MDYRQVLKWLLPIVVRGLAWILAAWLGMEATAADSNAAAIGEALLALVLVGISVYTSIKGRKTLLETPAP